MCELISNVNKTLKNIGIVGNIDYPLSSMAENYINYSISEDLKTYKKGIKKVKKLYKKFKFDVLMFKIDLNNYEDKEHETVIILNRFLDICSLGKPTEMRKVITRNKSIERMYFYWDLNIIKINTKILFKEIMFINDDGFKELYSSVFFVDTKNDILFNFYDNRGIEILSSGHEDLLKFL